MHFEGGSRAALSGGLQAITPALSAADLTVVNLETAITERGTRGAGKQFTFRAPPSALTALQAAGVDVVTLANNHGMDYGQVGLADTLAAPARPGLPLVGAGRRGRRVHAARHHGQGPRVAVIGATQVLDASLAAAWTATADKPGLASAKDVERLLQAVRAARAQADIVVVDLHWGTEQVSCPTAAQRELAGPQLVAAGADVVVGSHAHVLLGGGWLDDAYVDYGLGNFVFYARTPPTQATGVLTLTVQGRAVTAAQWSPAQISGGVPRPLQGPAAAGGAGRQGAAARLHRAGRHPLTDPAPDGCRPGGRAPCRSLAPGAVRCP